MAADNYKAVQIGLYGEKLNISAWITSGEKQVVTIVQYAGSMSFQYSMSPSDARELAGKLFAAANAFADNDGLDGMQSAATDVFAKPASVAA